MKYFIQFYAKIIFEKCVEKFDNMYYNLRKIQAGMKKVLKLNIKGTQKMAQIMKELETYKLIVYKKVGLNKCNEIYLAMPDELGELYSDDDLLNHDDDEHSEPLTINGGLKIKHILILTILRLI